MPSKLKPISIIFIVLFLCFIFLLKTPSTEFIPNEDPKEQQVLGKLIILSKYDPKEAIFKLQNYNFTNEYTDYKKDYILAKLFEKEDQIKNAIQTYQKVINKNYPLKERVVFHLANLKAKEGNDKEALKLFNKLLRDFPHSKSVPQAKYHLAQTQLRLKLTKEAIHTLRSLKKEFPKTQFGIATNFYLGEYALNNKNYNEAIQYFREYLKLSPDGRFASEIADLITKKKEIILTELDYSLLGNVFFHKKEYNNAALFYKTSKNSRRFYECGYSLFRIGNKLEAFHYFKEFAYKFPKAKNVRYSLLYASKCIPYYERKLFWKKIAGDIPELAYYTLFKEALLEKDINIKKKRLKSLIHKYPNSDFVLDAVWEIMWEEILDKNYGPALEIGEKYFNLSKDLPNFRQDSLAKIGFWLGKISEITHESQKALNFYEQTKNLIFDNYYSIRSAKRLLAMNQNNENSFIQKFNVSNFTDFNWSIPKIIKPKTIQELYGASVLELINLRQYDEAIDLIGKSKSPLKKVTSWLKALNNENEISINLANSIGTQYKLNPNNPIWELAYPLYFFEIVISTCKNYPSLDPFLVFGIIRQESRFDPKAVSISNALGLMQLIPQTARSTARLVNLNLNSIDELKDPKTNITLGINYFNGLINSFNNPLFAIASYNAGPQATQKWINKFNHQNDLDFFIERIEYDQTKEYVKKVYASYWTYIKLYKSGLSNI